MSGTLLAELPEDHATGEIAVIYEEIRRFSGVPYVSSLQRYLATMPGVLEWAWSAVRPAMVSGVIPDTGWRLANDVLLTLAANLSDQPVDGFEIERGRRFWVEGSASGSTLDPWSVLWTIDETTVAE